MNKRLKKELQKSFTAPPPIRKAEFLKELRFPKTTYRDFLYSQFRYIRKRVWIASIMTVLIGGILAILSPGFCDWNLEASKLWLVSAILPFLAWITVMEIYRSAAYRMAELEVSCRYSLSQIIMARITILGVTNLGILIVLLILMNRISAYDMFQVNAYLVVPYLLVCSVCLWILNHARSQEGVYGCSVAAGLVCTVSILLNCTVPNIYTREYVYGWMILLACSCICIGYQSFKLIKHMEDGTWNLYLTE